jgi:predicted RNA binding protein YcfA (HicA-like mRNA interferase family)
MPERLNPCSGQEAVKKLQRIGWSVARRKGSHVMMIKAGYEYALSIPQHDELGLGLLRKIMQSGLTIEEFNSL